MKLENVFVVIYFMFILLFASLGIENELFIYNRPLFAITMNLCIVFGIIGYWIGEKEQKNIREKCEIIEKYLEERCRKDEIH